jgi:transcriptional regulator with XRE-family HTH domain/plasmid stabilization system protein ParE
VDGHRGLGEFLRNRRARIAPKQVGLPGGVGRRQTPGLRREELAALAGVSVDYYTRLEQGRDTNPSPAILEALADALGLDRDERAHLRDIALHTTRRTPARTGATVAPRPGLLRLLETVRPTPAYVLSPTSDLLAANAEGLRLLVGIDDWPPHRRNLVRYVFTHPAARRVFACWQQMAEDCVAHLRTVEAADPGSPALAATVAQLCAESADFAALWRRYDVRVKSGARRAFDHPEAGRFELTSEILTAPDGQRFVAFQPGTDGDTAAIARLALTA